MKNKILLFILLLILVSAGCGFKKRTIVAPPSLETNARNPLIENVKIIIPEGARPRFAPDNKSFVFDKKNNDGYYDLYQADINGKVTLKVTEGREGINQRNNGNGTFDLTGRYIVFISEENNHFLDNQKYLGDPGLGMFCNLYAYDTVTQEFYKLTNLPIKKSLADKTLSMATVNPHFSLDGKQLIWTERYAEGGNNNWGKWRLKEADFIIEGGKPILKNEHVAYTPQKGNYVTFMGELSTGKWIVSGNLDGQHEYGMDQYILDIKTDKLTNLTNTPKFWEEDSSLMPDGRIVYMTNIDSPFTFNFNDANWAAQPMERDYYIMNNDGSNKQRLTYFNDSSAPEYQHTRILSVASDISSDGKHMLATLGFDTGTTKRSTTLKIALITLR